MPGETALTGIDTTEVTADGATLPYPRVTTDFYITKSVSLISNSTTTYANVIVTLTNVEVNDFATVWDNIKANIINNINTMTT